jgi:hypothetical protein
MHNLRFVGVLLASTRVSSMHPSVPQGTDVPASQTRHWERTRTTWTEWRESSNCTPYDLQGQCNSGNIWNDAVVDNPRSEHSTGSPPTVDVEKTLQTLLDNQNKIMHDLEEVLKHDAKVIRTDAMTSDVEMIKHDAKGVVATVTNDIKGLSEEGSTLALDEVFFLVIASVTLAVLLPVILGTIL